MGKTVVGLYDTENLARQAADELKRNGFDDLPVHVETQETGTSSFTREREDADLVHALEDSGVPRDDAEFYTEGVRRGGGLLIVETPDEQADNAARFMNMHEPIQRERREPDWRERGYTGYEPEGESFTSEALHTERERFQDRPEEESEEAHMTEAREEMHVGKRKVEGGGARIHKRVIERPVEEEVELREEEVDVERQRATESTAEEDPFQEETVEMSETREEPVVEKETHIEGEVVAKKKARERSETVQDTVRETEIDIEDLSEGFEEYRPRFREHYESTFGDTERGYDEYEPAYQFGYAYGSHEDYAGHNFKRAESQLRRDYERRHGKGTFDRVRGAVRHGFRVRMT